MNAERLSIILTNYLNNKISEQDVSLTNEELKALEETINLFHSFKFNEELDSSNLKKRLKEFKKNELVEKIFDNKIVLAMNKIDRNINIDNSYNIAEIMYELDNEIFKLQKLFYSAIET